MDLRNYYIEEDLFPSLFTNCLERPYGVLFYNPDNKDSFDSNHAVIYKDKIDNLGEVLKDISEFYKCKGPAVLIIFLFQKSTETLVPAAHFFMNM